MKPELLHRERLVDHAARLLDTRLGVVVAPSGAGKTVLLHQWREALSGVANVAMLTMTFAHNSAPVTRAALGEAVRDVLPTLGWGAGDPISPTDLPDFVRAAEPGARRDPSLPLVIMVDDFDAVTDESVRGVFATAVEVLPADAHVLFASRAAPPFLTSRWRRDGLLFELDAHDLAFTVDEVADLSHLLGRSVDAAALAEQTHGWAAAVSLLLQDRKPQRAIRQLIDEEVLPGLPAAQLEFLLDTAPLNSITVDRADALRGADDSGLLLEGLRRRGGFPLPVAEGAERWMHPPVVRDHLEQMATRRDATRAAEMRLRAAALATESALSGRELEVLALLDSELSIAQIASSLSISYHTAKSHVRSIYSKLDARTRTAAVRSARAAKLLPD